MSEYTEHLREVIRLEDEIEQIKAENGRLKEILQKVVYYIDYFKVESVGQISWGGEDSTMGRARKAFEQARKASK